MLEPKKLITLIVAAVGLIVLIFMNPWSWNDAGYRTVVTQASGKQFSQFEAGIFYSGFFAKEQVWPNQISVSYRDSLPNLELVDNTIEIGWVGIRFNDATTAKASGITQYILPVSEKEMLDMHNAHKTPEALVTRRIGPYTQECLQNSAQLMSSEMHYGGGRAQMAQDYLDQLKNGAFLLRVQEQNSFDSLAGDNKKTYQVEIKMDKDGKAMRKFSSIKEYGITVADAQITDMNYETAVDVMLQKKIAAATEASVSKQQLMTAQQQKLTAEAKGQQRLVEIEYQQKQEQTKLVVAAQTKVEVAKQDLLQQDIALQASRKEAEKIKTLADAEAYQKAKVMAADGALEKKLTTYENVMGYAWDAIGKYQGNWVPTYSSGGGSSGNGAFNMMEALSVKMLRDLNLDLNQKK